MSTRAQRRNEVEDTLAVLNDEHNMGGLVEVIMMGPYRNVYDGIPEGYHIFTSPINTARVEGGLEGYDTVAGIKLKYPLSLGSLMCLPVTTCDGSPLVYFFPSEQIRRLN